ncbi:MAG TPA: anthranilate synthase component I family protein [Candidatus Polarisedimenticolaceae bacterium]|nr:anthranilate synthase component I family protein [Candidatus Polarisedimenticolaceae bacterium]
MTGLLPDGLRPSYLHLRAAPDPLALFRGLYDGQHHRFLYESRGERGGRGRYSFLGGRPLAIFRSRDRRIEIERDGRKLVLDADPLSVLKEMLTGGVECLPIATFPGGAVGYLGYDLVHRLVPVPGGERDDLGLPDAQFLFPGEVVIVDHLDEVVHVVVYGTADERDRCNEIGALARRSAAAVRVERDAAATADPDDGPEAFRTSPAAGGFRESVRRAKDYIRQGEIYQVVLSQRFDFPLRASPLAIYAALRRENPSPYLYLLDFDGMQLAGSSPEVLVKLTGRRAVTRPLAGTRPRGATPERDASFERELRQDPKERAEHVMLVDLARNDLGRVCRVGSVTVDEFLEVERYAKVMHLVSNVEGRLRDDRDAFDLLAATFPAGTVSGAPKVRAMQIIRELERFRRGPYAGAIGYFGFHGDMDMCIAIRTLLAHRGRGYLQAGAGIVADSDPDAEQAEIWNKARGTFRALARAGTG